MSLGRVTGEAKSMKGTNTKNRIIKGLLGALCVLNLAAVGSIVGRETIKDKISAQNMEQKSVTYTVDEKALAVFAGSVWCMDGIVLASVATKWIIEDKKNTRKLRAMCKKAEKEENEEKYKL